MRECKYPGKCESRSAWGKNCKSNIACCHQAEKLNTESIIVGPAQDGRWYIVPNDDFVVNNQGG